MNCPACGKTLKELTVENLTVDVCDGGCGGVWFDNYELDKVDEPHEVLGEALTGVAGGAPVDHSRKRNCPRCGTVTMLRHFFGVKKEIEIDECGKCGGFWLDHGELKRIREQFASPAEKDKAEKEWVAQFDHELEAMRAESQEKLERAQRFAKAFRFICPSYYIPGKQRGAAF